MDVIADLCAEDIDEMQINHLELRVVYN